MKDEPLQITRKRHYFYVLAFSVAVWLFIAMAIGGLVPVKYINVGVCPCRCQLHSKYWNISYLYYGIAGIILGLIFSYPLNRLNLVLYTKPDDTNVSLSGMAKDGKRLINWFGLIVMGIILGAYLLGNYITHRFVVLHPTKNEMIQSDVSLIRCASGRGDLREVKYLIQHGADINTLNLSRPPLYYAALNCHKEVVTFLIENGANINQCAFETPLHDAVEGNHPDVVEMLMEAGSDIDKGDINENDAPLHYAARLGYGDIVEVLISKGAEVNTLFSNGWTILNVTLRRGQSNFAKVLRSHGAKTAAELKADQKKK